MEPLLAVQKAQTLKLTATVIHSEKCGFGLPLCLARTPKTPGVPQLLRVTKLSSVMFRIPPPDGRSAGEPITGPFYPQNMALFIAGDIEGRREIPSPWDSHDPEQRGWGPRRSPFMPSRKMMAFSCGLMESFSNSYPPAEPHCMTVLFSSSSVQTQPSPSSPFSPSPPPTPRL